MKHFSFLKDSKYLNFNFLIENGIVEYGINILQNETEEKFHSEINKVSIIPQKNIFNLFKEHFLNSNIELYNTKRITYQYSEIIKNEIYDYILDNKEFNIKINLNFKKKLDALEKNCYGQDNSYAKREFIKSFNETYDFIRKEILKDIIVEDYDFIKKIFSTSKNTKINSTHELKASIASKINSETCLLYLKGNSKKLNKSIEKNNLKSTIIEFESHLKLMEEINIIYNIELIQESNLISDLKYEEYNGLFTSKFAMFFTEKIIKNKFEELNLANFESLYEVLKLNNLVSKGQNKYMVYMKKEHGINTTKIKYYKNLDHRIDFEKITRETNYSHIERVKIFTEYFKILAKKVNID